MKVGYIRVSKHEQHEDLQKDALIATQCDKLFTDKISGVAAERKGLEEALAFLRPGDTFVVWKLDRAGRSLNHLMELLQSLQNRDISFVSLTEQIDTTTPTGKMIFTVLGAVAELERSLIAERVRAGLRNAKAKGKRLGRKRT